MRHPVAVSVLLMIASTAASAQTSRALVRSDPRASYAIVKELYRQAYAAKPMRVDPSGVDLVDCGDDVSDASGEDVFAGGDAVLPLAKTAHDVERLRALLTAAGYPERIWRPLLAQYEERQLAFALQATGGQSEQGGFEESPAEKEARRFHKKFADALNGYRRSAGVQLPEVTYEGGCGAGEIGVYVKTIPANAVVVFIPRFFYQLCQKQGVDPTDTRRCDWWREAAENMLTGFAGDYLYRARWSDGRTREGRISFTDPKEGQTFVIRKP